MPILILIVVIVLILVFVKRIKEPLSKGERGEKSVSRVIGETIENQQYVINNLIIKSNNSTIQIDHIVINPRGIFVIETKNYSGEIYGSEKQHDWIQVLAGGNVKNKIYNPIKQNASHIYNVKRIVGSLPIYSLIVFVQNNADHINAENVINMFELRSRLTRGEKLLSTKQMQIAYKMLTEKRVNITNEEHIKNINEQRHKVDLGFCPRCGARLVARESEHGYFWGCANYPKCKFTKKI